APVARALQLLEGGATVPFIARYRKEATSGLDDGALQRLSDHAKIVEAREARREHILETVRAQGALTPELEHRVRSAATRAELERYRDHVGLRERASRAPSHRVLAAERGEAEGVLKVSVEVPRDHVMLDLRRRVLSPRAAPLFARELSLALDEALDRLLLPSL